jgi:methyl-accepting chemotaxis protein
LSIENIQKSIGIVGGGKAGLQLLNLFQQSDLTSVQYVVDLNPNAPAMQEAKKLNIAAITDLEKALSGPVDYIFEVTGNKKVQETIARLVDPAVTSVVTHDMTFIILKTITDSELRIRQGVVNDITLVKTEITQSLQGIQRLVDNINSITSQMQILSINARIEAARVGEHGKGFAVVATEMGKSAEMVKEITTQIQTVNAAIASTSERINTSLNRLNAE